MNSSRGAKPSKPPLGTINGSITSGVTSYKYNRSRDEPMLSGRENSAGSYRSIDNTTENSKSPGYIKSYMRDTKKSVASKLSATLPKSSGYKKYSSTSNYKSTSYHK